MVDGLFIRENQNMKKLRILGQTSLQKHHLEELGKFSELELFQDNAGKDYDETIRRTGDAEIIIINSFTHVNRYVLDNTPNLKEIITACAGTNHIDLEACRDKGIPVRSYSGYCARTLAEKSFALILMSMNKMLPAILDTKAGNWNYAGFQGRELAGKKLGIFGMGSTGQVLKGFAEAFGMGVSGTNSKTPMAESEEILAGSDVISLHMPLDEQTKHFLNADRLAMLKKDVVIVNAGRGALIDEQALIGYLRDNPAATAALDVLEQEPPEPDNPLLHIPNAIVLPHIGWLSEQSSEVLANSVFKDAMTVIKA